jgi:DNA-binding YbaB/EbfC family protein
MSMSEGFDLQGMLAQAQEMQQRMLEAQQATAELEVEGQAGGGMVRITATGAGEFLAVRIDPEVVKSDETELLEDLVLAALRDVGTRVAALGQQTLGGLGLGDLGGLGGLLGGA